MSEKAAAVLQDQGYYRGNPQFEAEGIFELVTRPRCDAVITGRRPDGRPVPGRHTNGRLYSAGFTENIEYYRLDYLDPDDVDLGRQFDAIVPLLWLTAGGIGPRECAAAGQSFSMPVGSPYAVLFRQSRFRQFREALLLRPDITHVWLVTDSEDAFAEMRPALPGGIVVSMLYRDYLRNFRINTERSL